MRSIYSGSSSKVWHPKLCVSNQISGPCGWRGTSKPANQKALKSFGITRAGRQSCSNLGFHLRLPCAPIKCDRMPFSAGSPPKCNGHSSQIQTIHNNSAFNRNTSAQIKPLPAGRRPKVAHPCTSLATHQSHKMSQAHGERASWRVFNALNMLHHLHANHSPRDKARCIPLRRHVLLTLSPVDSLHLYVWKKMHESARSLCLTERSEEVSARTVPASMMFYDFCTFPGKVQKGEKGSDWSICSAIDSKSCLWGARSTETKDPSFDEVEAVEVESTGRKMWR